MSLNGQLTRARRRLVAGGAVLTLAAVGCAPTQSGSDQVPDINVDFTAIRDAQVAGLPAAVDAIMADFLAAEGIFTGGAKIPGCAVGVMEQNGLSRLEGYGFADLSTNRPFDHATPAVVGSVSKTWTALAALRLVEMGLVGLEDTVGQHIPSAPPDWQDKTLRQLLSHTSGIARDPTFNPLLDHELELSQFWFGFPIPQLGIHPRLVMISYAGTDDIGFDDGATARYSNTGYMIAGALIDTVVADNDAIIGEDFDTYESFVWRQVGGTSLTAGRFSQALNEYWRQTDIPNLAKGYNFDAGSNSFQQILFANSATLKMGPAGWEGPPGGWTMTIGDLVRLMVAIQTNSVVSEATKNLEMMAVYGSDSNGNWGLGVNLIDKLGRPVYMHDGKYPGYRARYTAWPDEAFGVAIMCNGDDADLRKVTDEIGKVFFDAGAGGIGGHATAVPLQTRQPAIIDDDPGLSARLGRDRVPPDLREEERRRIAESVAQEESEQVKTARERERITEVYVAAVREHGIDAFEPLTRCHEKATRDDQVLKCADAALAELERRGVLDELTRGQVMDWLTQVGSGALVADEPITSGDDDTLSVSAAASKHATYRLDTWRQLVHKWRMLHRAGLRLQDLEVLQYDSGKRIYAGVWLPGSGKQALYRLSTWSAFVDKWTALNADGYRLIDIERVRHGNKMWYYGVWQGGGGKYALYHYKSWSAFTDKWAELNENGMRLIDIDLSEHDGVMSYIGVWRGGSGKYALYNYGSWSNFVDKWKTLGSQGYQLIDMDVVRRSNGTTRYVGVWRAGSPKRALYRYTHWNAFKRKWAELAEKGYALVDVEVAQRNEAGTWYVGSFVPAPNAPIGGPYLRVMAQYLEDALGEDDVVGMSYAISQHGQLAIAGSTGFAQRAPDDEVPMTSKVRSTIASVSKAITAPPVYKLLRENGLTVDSPVGSWLPASWTKGDGFDGNDVTFLHLLTHTSGLDQAFAELKADGEEGPWGNNWDGLKFVVENGTAPDSRSYKNANFALMRVLIPKLWKAVGGPGGQITKANVGDRYLSYLHELVLDREGIDSIACWPQAGYPEAKSYNFDDSSKAGASSSSSLDACGGHANLHFSAQELTRYAAAFRYNDAIMAPADRATMRTERAGWKSAVAVTDGTAYSHGGSWNKGGGRKTRTCMMELPHGVNASIIINSNPPVDKCSVLRQAYNAAMDED